MPKSKQVLIIVTVFIFINLLMTLYKLNYQKTNTQIDKSNITSIEYKNYSFKSYEHPFVLLNTPQSDQTIGNGLCLNEWQDMEILYVINDHAKLQFKSSMDGVDISDQWHIWYHVDSNLCISNK